MKSCFLALVFSMVAYTQSLDQLKQNYGSPIFVTFKVSNGVGVKVKLRADGVIPDMLILPISPDTLVESRKLTFTAEEARGVLDKLVPASKRGRLIGGGFVNALCNDNDCGGSDADYENLHVFYNSASIVGRLC